MLGYPHLTPALSRELFRLVEEQLSWLGWPWRWRSWRSSPALLRGQHRRRDGRWAVGRRSLLGDGLGHLAQFQPVPFEHSLGHFTQVVQEVPPIRDLKRLRSGKPCCLHVGLSAIQTQDSDLGMRGRQAVAAVVVLSPKRSTTRCRRGRPGSCHPGD